MISLLSEIHFWTTQEDILVKDIDYGSYKYFFEKDAKNSIHAQAKQNYCNHTGIIYALNKKKPEKLRDKLRELEEHLVLNKIVYYCWDNNKLKLLLSTGLIVHLTINQRTGDLISIVFDKQLAVKLQVNIICDGVLFGPQVICVCNDGHVLGFGGPWKEGWVLEGGPRKRLHYHNNWLVVYGKAGVEHPQPWSPLAKDHQRANLHLYWIGTKDPQLLAYKKTDGEPLIVVVSKICANTIIIVEQKVTQKGAVSVEIGCLKLLKNTLKRFSVTSVPLQTQVSCTALSENEERLLIGCIDGTLAILDRNRSQTRVIKAAFIPTIAAWHPEGVVVAAANEKGCLQYYDTAVNCIKNQLTSEDCIPATLFDLSGYCKTQFTVASISWGPKDLLFSLEQGPLAVLTHVPGSLGFKAMTQLYIKSGRIENAIKLLLSWEFNDEAFFALQQITMHLLRKPLTDEIAQYLQDALGSFYNSFVPLSTQVKHKLGHQVISITRRYFYQLMRAHMFETAFLLAVDVGHHDLFMDLYYIAVKLGETEMAAAARAQASALLSRCSSEASNCSRSSCSQCSDSEESSISPENFEERKANILMTDFMHASPTTYKTEGRQVNKNPETLPKRPLMQSRATYVKAPQVPSSFLNQIAAPVLPPLPFYRATDSSSYVQQYVEATAKDSSLDTDSLESPAFSPLRPTTTTMNLKSANLRAKDFPPLPVLNNNERFLLPVHDASSRVKSDNLSKKSNPKVKFSDTVTAFIVPEMKRPVSSPLPAHLTDPRRELAESLPLCHPNEDYLKDFAPVKKKDDDDDKEATGAQSKIKVVHFGVV